MIENIFTGACGTIGALCGWIKISIMSIGTTEVVTTIITWNRIFEVLLCAALGALVGLTIKEIWNFTKKKIFKK